MFMEKYYINTPETINEQFLSTNLKKICKYLCILGIFVLANLLCVVFVGETLAAQK